VNFWQKGGTHGLRRISLIYYPEYVRKVTVKQTQQGSKVAHPAVETIPLFDLEDEELEFEEADFHVETAGQQPG
jgi:hypothetical protein